MGKITSIRIDSDILEVIKEEYTSLTNFVNHKLVTDDSITANIFNKSKCSKLIARYEKLLNEMALSPQVFIARIRANVLQPSFREYMCQYIAEKYNAASKLKGHNWLPEAIRLLLHIKSVYQTKVTFNDKNKMAKVKEAITDVDPSGIAKKAKDKVIAIVRENGGDAKLLSRMEKFDTTKGMDEMYKAFLLKYLPSEFKDLVK